MLRVVAPRMLLLPLSLLLLLPAAAAPAAWKQDVFAISFWVDPIVPPAEYDYRYAEIAAANFTLVVGGYGATTRAEVAAQLAACEKHGLKALPSLCANATCGRSHTKGVNGAPWVCPEPALRDGSAADLESPALWGWKVTDEPSATSPGTPGSPAAQVRPGLNFSTLASFNAALERRRPDKLRYVNLLQDYAAPGYWGVQTYEQYLQQYITTNKPQLLSFDHYPFFQADNKVAPDETVILLHPPFFL